MNSKNAKLIFFNAEKQQKLFLENSSEKKLKKNTPKIRNEFSKMKLFGNKLKKFEKNSQNF